MTALEALYCGKMPLVSINAGVSEILIDKKIGIVFDPKPSILAQKIKSYLQNPKKFEKMLFKGQNWVREELNVKKYAEKNIKFYLSILQRN
jgi:glycosyltransferase involved in cell wall biosynthesis